MPADEVNPWDLLGVFISVEENGNEYRGFMKVENGHFYIKDKDTETRIDLGDGYEVKIGQEKIRLNTKVKEKYPE